MNLLIVLVNYNGSGLTIDCLRSLAPELEQLPGARVGLCDNGSEPGEMERIAAAVAELGLAERVALRSVRRNQGFTGGNNVVIREALASPTPPDAVMLLNNDTLVLPGAVTRLVEFLRERPEAALCGSRLEHPDGESQRAARRVLTAASELESYARLGIVTRLLSRWLVAPPEPPGDEPTTCGWVPGAALMIRTGVLEQIGLLDEGLYTYFDDVDYCLRARRAGWPTWYVPQSRIVHLVGKTTHVTEAQARPKRRPAYWFEARRRYFLNNFGAPYTALADLAAIAGLALHKAKLAVTRRPDPDPPRLMTDLARSSVLLTGFRRRPVNNPLTGAPVVSSAEKVSAV